jgi:hypothetical protein
MSDLHPFRAGTVVLSDADRSALALLGRDAGCDALASSLASGLADGIDAASAPRSPGAAALAALAVDWARCGVSASASAAALEEAGWPPARASTAAAAFAARAGALRARLSAGAPLASLPRVTGVRWRLDYALASKDGGRAAAPLYLVDLHLAAPPHVRSFSCTPAELDDLRLKVKDALAAAAALAASAPA